MKFFQQLYTKVLLKPSIKFRLNTLFLTQSIQFLYKSFLVPYFFIPTKFLKIKFLKINNFNTLYLRYSYIFLGITLILVFIFYYC